VTEDSEDVAYIAVTVGGPVRRITFCTKSHDQGFSGEPEHHGKYAGSWTWFEAGMIPAPNQANASGDLERPTIQRNVCAQLTSRIHHNDWNFSTSSQSRREWLAAIQLGDNIGVFPKARFSGWVNYVEAVKIEVWCAMV